MRGMKAAVLLCALVLSLSAVRSGAAVRDLNTVKEGDPIPAFKGRNLVGDEVDVGALLGKKGLVLAFWSIYCKPCVEEISSLIRLQEQLGGQGLEVIGINADSDLGVARIRSFISRFEEFEKKKINYQIVFDEGNKISKLLGVGFLPTVLSVNLKGQVEKVFMGFEEKSEPEILAGIRRILPMAEEEGEKAAEGAVYAVEAVVPLCGFYDSSGWKGSFTENYDLQKELEKTAEAARRKALKMALREALVGLGISLMQDPQEDSCFRPYGVYLMDDPLQVRDCLSNLIRVLPTERLTKVVESQEEFLGSEYRASQRISVKLPDLRSALEDLKYQFTPRTVNIAVVNIKKLDQTKFERALVLQSRYIGFASFPTYTIYTSPDEFSAEVKRMDFGGLRLFVEEAGEDRIEVEVWR